MNDDQSQQNTDAQTTTDHDQSVLYERPLDRETILSSLHNPSNGQPRPVTPGHGKAQDLRENADRQTMPERGQEQQVDTNNLSVEPDDQPRPTMVDPGINTRPAMTDHAPDSSEQLTETNNDSNESEVPPDSTDLVTVEEAVIIFAEAGLPRHIRTIQKYCAKKKGRALVSYQIPTENGIRYMIERSSIDRFISDAIQQAPTGKLEEEPATPQLNREEIATPSTNSVQADLAVYDHPYVKRLESEVEKEKERYASLQMRYENAMDMSNQRLVELQQASAVAQSESLGHFLIESKRMEIEPELSPAPVHKQPVQGESMVQ
ncbi:MAG: hypothetical protein GY927_18850 [bacterium]|nr:hypothetical protein [bacterium]